MTQPNPLEQFFKDYPDRCVPPVIMSEPNEHINIYSGSFTLKRENVSYNVNGDINFKWFPYMSVSFLSVLTHGQAFSGSLLESYDIYINEVKYGSIKLMGIDFSADRQLMGISSGFIWGEKNVSVDEVTFVIPNLRDYLGNPVKDPSEDGGVHLEKTRLTFDDHPYVIVIDKLPFYQERKDKLVETSGYLTLYAGKITSKKGAINLADLKKWQDRFDHFLFFLNGLRTAPMFLTGHHEGLKIWTDYSSQTVEPYKFTKSWSDIFFLNDLPSLWQSFNSYWKEEADRDFLITAIHWYIEANTNSAKIEGSIILIQTALELIFNWLIVENQKQIFGNDADGLSAANKIRMLIFQLKISGEIPTAFTALAQVPNIQDGPEALVKIRNGLVHGQESKRRELMKISLQAKYEALQLGIWYVELSLLFILGYKGNYSNRSNGNNWRNSGELVPWLKQ